MKCLWRSCADTNEMSTYAQVIDMDGDKMLEVLIPKAGVWQRFKNALRYLFKGTPITLTRVLLDKDIKAIGGIYDRESSKDK